MTENLKKRVEEEIAAMTNAVDSLGYLHIDEAKSKQLIKTIEELLAREKWNTNEYDSEINEAISDREKLELAREGLEFYANCKSQNNWDDFWKDIEDDGKIAKETLAKLKG